MRQTTIEQQNDSKARAEVVNLPRICVVNSTSCSSVKIAISAAGLVTLGKPLSLRAIPRRQHQKLNRLRDLHS